jgi:ethanolamine utilization protein EutN
MHLGRVIGTVVSTKKDETLQGVKLLVVQPLDETLYPAGESLVAADTVMAGPNDLIYFVIGKEAAYAVTLELSPLDATIVGLVDRVTTDTAGSG